MRPAHGAVYHVTTRSNAGEHIFRGETDYVAGVRTIAKLVRQGFFRCHGFCLMPTHYHLLASFPENGLRPAIQRLNRRYAAGFNDRHDRHGHVFGSRYRAVPIESDVHGDWLPTYVAENPPFRPWPWSSYDTPFAFVEPLPWD
ncbi:MAG TPA: transposase [Gaiellaceae bacterium]|nr:transposase [Gaiellaceae bacterium]